jgi:transcription elongation factor
VYRQHVFLFNENFKRSYGIVVETVDNCASLSRNDTGKVKQSTEISGNGCINRGEEITVGMTLTLRNGPMKGYKGVVKSITS